MLKLIVPALILLLTAAPHAHPGTITVRPDGTGDYPTIQAAINAAANGDEIVCTDGTYTGPGNRDIDFLGKAITVHSESGPQNCIIDCNGTQDNPHRGFYFHNNEDTNSVLDGFSISNGYGLDKEVWGKLWSAGGAILCERSSPKIVNCVIEDNYAAVAGGIFCEHSKPAITNCTFSGNSFTVIYCEYSSTTISNCSLTENVGSAIYSLNSTLTVTNCLIANNAECDEGAIFCSDCNVTIADCTIASNAGGGIGCHQCTGTISLSTITDNHGYNSGGIACEDCNLVITDCTISGNSGSGIGCSSPYYSVLTVRDCNIASNIARVGGALSYAGPVDAEITDCKITGNWAEDGGAIFCYKASPTISNCEIAENIAKIIDCSGSDPRGGAIYCRDSSPQIINCAISGNKADEGGGIYCFESNLRVDMCTISDNRSRAEGDPPGPIRGGGGVYCEDASLTITDTTMADNTADGNFSGGGAILCRGSTQLEITDCTIRGNSAKIRGGGICCDEETVATITGCKIIGNSSEASGGGILCTWETQTKINNCLVTGNSAKDAGGICGTSDQAPDITNCTIANNIAYGGYGGGIVMVFQCEATLDNCILWGNSAEDGDQIALVERCICSAGCRLTVNYSNVEGGPEAVYKPGHGPWWLDWDNGNIDADPCFVEPGYWDVNGVWVEGDYHLLEDSPCIDTGDPNYVGEPNETDLDGNPRVIDGDQDGFAVIDMGAFEFAHAPLEAQMKLKPHTLNCAAKAKSVKAHIILPEEILPEDIDVNEPAVADPPGIESEYIKVFATSPVRLEIAFDRRAFCETLTEPGQIEITVTASLTTGQYFYATDTIRIKPKRRQIIRKLLKKELNKPHSGKSP